MKFYYTGAETNSAVQNSPIKSLGGFMSSSVVPNGELSNLFGDISQYTIEKNKFNMIGIILKNELPNNIENLYFYFTYDTDTFVKMEVAAVSVNIDTKGCAFIEKIPNSTSLPYNGTFYEANTEPNKVNLGNLESGKLIGLWIKRSLIKANINEAYSEDNLVANFNSQTELNKLESVKINLAWTDV